MTKTKDKKDACGQMEQLVISAGGIPIYHYRNPYLHSFSICFYLKAGCLYESDEDTGITHFFEHMVFKNINHILGGELYKTLDRMGLEFNGATYKEFVQFEITGACQHFHAAAKIISMIFEPVVLSAGEISTERKRIKQEIRESDELKSLDHFTQEIVWKDTCLKNMIGGTFKSLDSFGPKKLEKEAQKLLSANNVFFYVTGNYQDSQIDALKEMVDAYPHPICQEDRKNIAPVPAVYFHRKPEVYVKNAGYYYVRLSFDVDTRLYSEAENSLFYDILFEGESCKIHQELSERTGMVYSFGSTYERYDNLGNLSLYYEVRQADLYESIKRTAQVLQNMKSQLKEELEYARPPYVDNAELLLDDVSDFNWTRAYECHILHEDYPDIEARKAAYLKVSTDRIMEMAKAIFKRENLVITMKGPKDKIDKEKILNIFAEILRD